MAGLLKDFEQDSKIATIETNADSTLETLQNVLQQVRIERARNDEQSARIQALADVLKRTLVHLTNLNAIQSDESEELLASLRKVMAPGTV